MNQMTLGNHANLLRQAQMWNKYAESSLRPVKLVGVIAVCSLLGALFISIIICEGFKMNHHSSDCTHKALNISYSKDCLRDCWVGYTFDPDICGSQFDIGNGLLVHVCQGDESNKVNIRLFINGAATIKGIYLSPTQWVKLRGFSKAIDSSLP